MACAPSARALGAEGTWRHRPLGIPSGQGTALRHGRKALDSATYEQSPTGRAWRERYYVDRVALRPRAADA